MNSPTPRSVLFVCTGNTCRSPLAESLCKARLAERFGCSLAELPDKGFVIRSAGVMAYAGDGASPPAVTVAAEWNADLASHRSQPLTAEMLAASTDVIAMTTSHLTVLQVWFGNVGPKPVLLTESGDIPDPIGGELDEYRQCATVIVENIDRLIEGWLK